MIQTILACDTSREYLYYMPITAYFWHAITGYKVVLVLVGAKEDWQLDKAALLATSFTKRICPNVEFIYFENKTKYPAYVISQLIRPLTALRYPDDFNIIGDVDMLPLQKDYFRVHDETRLHYFDPGVLGRPPHEIAMCYIGAKGSLWQKLLSVKHEDVTKQFLEEIIERYKECGRVKEYSQNKSKPFWGVDQMYMTEYVLASDEYKTNLFKPTERDVDKGANLLFDRIDRVRWEFDPHKKGYYIDAHLGLDRPWEKNTGYHGNFRKVLEEYIPDKVKDIDDYTVEFSRLIGLEKEGRPESNKELTKDALIVTAASKEYFPWLLNMIGSIQNNYSKHPPIIVYNLGLRRSHLQELRSIEGVAVKEISTLFPYRKNCYASKLWVMNDAEAEIVYFLDAASEVLRPLTEILEFINQDGYFCVSQASFKYNSLEDIIPKELLGYLHLSPEFSKGKEYFASGNFGFKRGSLYHECVKEAYALAEKGWALGWSVAEQYRNKGKNASDIIRNCTIFRHEQTLLNVIFYQRCGHFKIHNENKYAGYLSPKLHPYQLVWNSRRLNTKLRFLNKLHYKNGLPVFTFLKNRLFLRK